MGVKIKSALGSVTLDAENIASNTTVTVPAGGGTLANTGVTDALSTRVNAVGGRKNLIINGDMQVAQRGTSQNLVAGYNSLDRYATVATSAGATFTVSQDSDAPDGFGSSMKFACTGADTSVTGSERIDFASRIEAQDLQCLKYGSANAESVTLSFWVKSNVTGTYAVNLYQGDSTGNRMLNKNYTVDSANTWEKKTITYIGDTSGLINNDNGVGLYMHFALVAGPNLQGTSETTWQPYSNARFFNGHSVNLGSSTSNTYQITGIQLELGDTATDFEHRSYGEELALCQRYYQKWTNDSGSVANAQIGVVGMTASSNTYFGLHYKQEMRVAPSFTSGGSFRTWNSSQGAVTSKTPDEFFNPTRNGGRIRFSSGYTNGEASMLMFESTDAYIALDAEL